MAAETIQLDELPISVIRTDLSRRARLTVDRDGSLLLRAAPDVTEAELRDFVSSKRAWIYRRLADRRGPVSEPRELVNGESFSYLGRTFRLRLTGIDQVKLVSGRLLLPRTQIERGGADLIDWYSARGMAWLPKRAESWAIRMRAAPIALEVADLGCRWGIAHPDGRVCIHWATMQLRPALIDYVLAHELAHLREPNHGLGFWLVVERALPDFRQRKAQLAAAGASVWLGAVSSAGASTTG